MKGVNKLVMEIKPGSAQLSQTELSEGAERLLGLVKENKQKKKRNTVNAFLWSSAGAFFMWLVMFIIDKIC